MITKKLRIYAGGDSYDTRSPLPYVKKGTRTMETERLAPVAHLTEVEITNLTAVIADNLTYEATVDYFHAMVQADEKAVEGGSRIDKILWFIRHAYLDGFRKGIETYNEAANIKSELKKKPLLRQMMETAVEVHSADAIKQATDFLRGGKEE